MNKYKYLMFFMCLLALPCLAAKKDEVNYLDLAALMLRDGNLDRAVLVLDQVVGVDLLSFFPFQHIYPLCMKVVVHLVHQTSHCHLVVVAGKTAQVL